MAEFRSKEEFVLVFDKLWELVDRHPKVGPELKAARAPHRFVFSDLDLVLNVTWSEETGHNVRWVWGDDARDWEPLVTLQMKSDVANRYFQGKENVILAVTMGRIKLSGPMALILKLSPVMRPIEPEYRDMLAATGHDHLLV